MRNFNYREPPFEVAYPLLQKEVDKHLDFYKDGGLPLDADFDHVKNMMDAGLFKVLVQECDGEVVGYAGYTLSPHYLNPKVKVCSIMCLWVKKEWRGEGAGTALVQTVEDVNSHCVLVTINSPPESTANKIADSLGYAFAEVTRIKRM